MDVYSGGEKWEVSGELIRSVYKERKHFHKPSFAFELLNEESRRAVIIDFAFSRSEAFFVP